MERDVQRIRVLFILAILLSLAAVFLASPQTVLGITNGVGDVGELTPVYDTNAAPEEVVGNAQKADNQKSDHRYCHTLLQHHQNKM